MLGLLRRTGKDGGGTCSSTHAEHTPTGALVNEDYPQNDRQAAGTATTDTMDGDSGI